MCWRSPETAEAYFVLPASQLSRVDRGHYCVRLTAACVSPAVPARVARPGPNHPPTALGALHGVLPRVEQGGLAWRARFGPFRGAAGLLVVVLLREASLHLRREDPRGLLLLGGQELLAEPAEDVV